MDKCYVHYASALFFLFFSSQFLAADPVKIFGMMLPSMPSLMFKFGRFYLRFKRDAKKGGRIFQKELIKQGIDEETAEGLTETYLESSNLKNFVNFFN